MPGFASNVASRAFLRILIAAVACLAVVMSGAISPAAAVAAAPAAAGALASCASPPDTADATVETRDRFVDLWSARFADQAWLDDFTARQAVPADILAEGFHAMNDATKQWLATCLAEE